MVAGSWPRSIPRWFTTHPPLRPLGHRAPVRYRPARRTSDPPELLQTPPPPMRRCRMIR
jgi:hypothetical protein